MEDVSGQHIANRAALVVHPASLYVAVSRPPMFVDTKTGTTVDVVAVDLSGKPVVDVSVTVSLVREQWVRWERREISAGEWTVRTSAAPTPLSIPLREGGSYILRAIARDADGRQTRTETNFFALGAGVVVLAGRGQPRRSDAGTPDLEARRDRAHPDPLAVASRHRASHRRARRDPQSSSLHHHVHARHRRRADHRGRRAERLRVGDARQGPDVHRPDHRRRTAVVQGRLHGTVCRRLVEAIARGRLGGSSGVPAWRAHNGFGGRGGARWHARSRRSHSVGDRCRVALAHEVHDARRAESDLHAEGAAGHDRGQSPAAHEPPAHVRRDKRFRGRPRRRDPGRRSGPGTRRGRVVER